MRSRWAPRRARSSKPRHAAAPVGVAATPPPAQLRRRSVAPAPAPPPLPPHSTARALRPLSPSPPPPTLTAQVGGDALAFFGEGEVLPEPKSSISGVATDGLGGYKTDEYAMDESGKDPGFAKAA